MSWNSKKKIKIFLKPRFWVKSSISNRNVMTEHFHRFRQLVSWEHIWCAQTFFANYLLQPKYDSNQIYHTEICFSSERNAKHTISYMHTEYLQSHQIIISSFLDGRILALFFEYCWLAQDWSQYLSSLQLLTRNSCLN